MQKILFVCLGNICRSPLGEGIFRDFIVKQNRDDTFFLDSAGTGKWHVGSPPHEDSQRIAAEYGIDISKQRARQVQREDFNAFDFIIAMDRQNRRDLKKITRDGTARIHCLREFDPIQGDLDVPDPYFGGYDGFQEVFTIIERCCAGLFEATSE